MNIEKMINNIASFNLSQREAEKMAAGYPSEKETMDKEAEQEAKDVVEGRELDNARDIAEEMHAGTREGMIEADEANGRTMPEPPAMYGCYVKSHCEAPDFEYEISAFSREEAVEKIWDSVGHLGWEWDTIDSHTREI